MGSSIRTGIGILLVGFLILILLGVWSRVAFLAALGNPLFTSFKIPYPSGEKIVDSMNHSDPRWSPDGNRLVVVNGPIYVMNHDGTDKQAITERRNKIDTQPDWSPDGKKIVFVSNRTDALHIYTMNVDGSNVEKITDLVNATCPRWSPDGKRIAFSVRQSESNDLIGMYTMNVDGSILSK